MSITTLILALLGWITAIASDAPFLRGIGILSNISSSVPKTVCIVAICIAVFHEIFYRDFFHEYSLTGKSIFNFVFEVLVDIGSFLFIWNFFFVIEYIWDLTVTICKDINLQLPEITETGKLAIAIIVESSVAAKGLGNNMLSKPYYLLISTLGIVSFAFNQEQYISFWCLGVASIVAFAGELITQKGKFRWRMLVDIVIDVGAYLIMYQYLVGAIIWAITKITTQFAEVSIDFTNWMKTIQVVVSILFELAVIFEFEYTGKNTK